jgi:hypothetical protein
MDEALPLGSPPEQLLQPICFDLVYRVNNKERCQTVVFYDIAGENCVDHEKMKGFGRFVENSDGIILVIDPKQFSDEGSVAEPVKVIDTIYTVFSNRDKNAVKELPLAVAISKGDTIAQQLIGQNLDDIQFLKEGDGTYIPRFNTADYNPIHDKIKSFVQANSNELHAKMSNIYDNYNYFLFSAIGTSTREAVKDGRPYTTPAGPPIPKRILEPILWLLCKYGFIESQGHLHEPKDWNCNTCGKRCRVSQKYCPECRTNNKGEWECMKCKRVNTGEWCPKCKTNRFGKKKGFFSR